MVGDPVAHPLDAVDPVVADGMTGEVHEVKEGPEVPVAEVDERHVVVGALGGRLGEGQAVADEAERVDVAAVLLEVHEARADFEVCCCLAEAMLRVLTGRFCGFSCGLALGCWGSGIRTR